MRGSSCAISTRQSRRDTALERLNALQALPPGTATAATSQPAAFNSADRLEGDDFEDWDEKSDSDEEGAPRSERDDPLLHAAVAHALGQPAASRAALVGADLPAEMRKAFERLVSARDGRIVVLE